MQLKSFYRISIFFSEAVAEGSLKAGKAMRIAIVLIVGTVVAGAAISALGGAAQKNGKGRPQTLLSRGRAAQCDLTRSAPSS